MKRPNSEFPIVQSRLPVDYDRSIDVARYHPLELVFEASIISRLEELTGADLNVRTYEGKGGENSQAHWSRCNNSKYDWFVNIE